jgi:hypothetical protein
METKQDAPAEQAPAHTLPKENTSGYVTEIPISVAKKWVDRLTIKTLRGRCKWILQGGSAELYLTDDMLFSIGVFEDGIIALEITTVLERWVSSINHHPEKEYRNGIRFFTKKIKPGELLYQEYRELLNIARASETGKINGDKNLIFNITHATIMSQ